MTGGVFEAGGLLRASSAAGLEDFLGANSAIPHGAAYAPSDQLEGIRRYGTT